MTGYKVFAGDSKNPRFLFFSMRVKSKDGYINYTDIAPIGKWIRAEVRNVRNYQTGFHIFTNIKDAKVYHSGHVMTVQYKGVLAIGKQGEFDTVVAKHMFIPKQEAVKK